MEQHGGKRLGAGRKKGSMASHTIEALEIRSHLIKEAIKEKKPLIKALMEKAKQGDVPALREILERTLGRVTEQINIRADEQFEELKKIQDGIREIIERERNVLK
jgi:hypothetical protein